MTWNLTGIRSRWQVHKKQPYGMTIILAIHYIEPTLATPFIMKCSLFAEKYVLKLEHDIQLKYKDQLILWNDVKKYKPGKEPLQQYQLDMYYT